MTKLIIKTRYLKQDILPHGNIAIGYWKIDMSTFIAYSIKGFMR